MQIHFTRPPTWLLRHASCLCLSRDALIWRMSMLGCFYLLWSSRCLFFQRHNACNPTSLGSRKWQQAPLLSSAHRFRIGMPTGLISFQIRYAFWKWKKSFVPWTRRRNFEPLTPSIPEQDAQNVVSFFFDEPYLLVSKPNGSDVCTHTQDGCHVPMSRILSFFPCGPYRTGTVPLF